VVNLRKIIFLTGYPGVGKTTVLLRALDELRKEGFSIGGATSREAREDGLRVGFKIADLGTGKEGWLAHVKQQRGPKIGKYGVCLEDLESIGVIAILNAVKNADIIIIDEVGPMELLSQAFKDAVYEALNSGKTVLGTIHYRAADPLIVAIKKRKDAAIIEVTQENRDKLVGLIVQQISESLMKS
jgi:nucleoside-triphosphatase